MEKVLIVDDDARFSNDIASLLKEQYKIQMAISGRGCLEALKKGDVSVVLLDMKLPDFNGVELVERIHKEVDPLMPIIIVTNYGQIENAVEAMRRGAEDFMQKGFNINLLMEKIHKALESRALKMRVRSLQAGYEGPNDEFIFASAAVKKLELDIAKIANQDQNVLLIGETGVGKDLVARRIHSVSKRKDKPYIQVPLSGINDALMGSELFGHVRGAFTGAHSERAGFFEAANGGTVYLPEISALSHDVQLKLLNFMQYKTIVKVGQDVSKVPPITLEVRLIMAANERDLHSLLSSGRIRNDFYQRAGLRLEIPPLRERKDAIRPLAEYFLRKHTPTGSNVKYRLSPEVIEAFMSYEWEGNVRELEEAIRTAITFSESDVLTLNDFRGCRFAGHNSFPGPFDLFESRQSYKSAELAFRERYFRSLIASVDGDVSRAAELSGMTPQGLRKTLKQLGIVSNGGTQADQKTHGRRKHS